MGDLRARSAFHEYCTSSGLLVEYNWGDYTGFSLRAQAEELSSLAE
jgi:hypothetical protein